MVSEEKYLVVAQNAYLNSNTVYIVTAKLILLALKNALNKTVLLH